jgi:hypothetical protein
MNIYKKPSKYVCNGIEFNSVKEAEFYLAGQLVKQHLEQHPEYAEKGPAFAAQVAVNVVFDKFQVLAKSNTVRGGILNEGIGVA